MRLFQDALNKQKTTRMDTPQPISRQRCISARGRKQSKNTSAQIETDTAVGLPKAVHENDVVLRERLVIALPFLEGHFHRV